MRKRVSGIIVTTQTLQASPYPRKRRKETKESRVARVALAGVVPVVGVKAEEKFDVLAFGQLQCLVLQLDGVLTPMAYV